MEEDERDWVSQGLPPIGRILAIIVHMTDLSLQFTDHLTLGNERINSQVLPHRMSAGKDGVAILSNLFLNARTTQAFNRSIQPVEDFLWCPTICCLSECVSIVGPGRETTCDADGVEQICLHRHVARIVFIELHEFEAVGFAIVSVRCGQVGGRLDGTLTVERI